MDHLFFLTALAPLFRIPPRLQSILREDPQSIADCRQFTELLYQERSDLIKMQSTPQFAQSLKQNETEIRAQITKGPRQIHVIAYWDFHYPPRLRLLEHPPWFLFYWGELPLREAKTLSIVGTRRPNDYGIELLERLIPPLKNYGIETVSGLANGIDFLAHKISCENDIPTFAVIGSGLSQLYPRENALLADQILERGGSILSEFPPLIEARPAHFPWRNRIIAGMAQALWVVQGTLKSGTKYTADYAMTLGTPILASPGDVFSELSQIGLKLIRDGIPPVIDEGDLIAALFGSKII